MWFTDIFIDYVPMYSKFRTVASILVIAEFTIPLMAMLALKEIISDPQLLTRKILDRHIEIGAVLLREGVFHFADGLARHQLVDGHLVVPGSAGAPDEEGDAAEAGYLRQESGDAINMNGKPIVERFAEGGKEYRYFPDEMAETAEGGEYLHEDKQIGRAHV